MIFYSSLVAGKAEGMARVVGAIVDIHVAGKTNAADEDDTDEQSQHTCDKPLRDRETGGTDRRRLRIHITCTHRED
jgi:hypothetical protein